MVEIPTDQRAPFHFGKQYKLPPSAYKSILKRLATLQNRKKNDA